MVTVHRSLPDPLVVEQLHTQTALLITAKLLQFLIYCSVENLGNRVENVSYCTDDDIKACCKEIYLFISGPAEFNTVHSSRSSYTSFEGKKSFAHGPSVTGVGTL